MNKKDKEVYQKIIEEQPYCQLCAKTNYLQIHHQLYQNLV